MRKDRQLNLVTVPKKGLIKGDDTGKKAVQPLNLEKAGQVKKATHKPANEICQNFVQNQKEQLDLMLVGDLTGSMASYHSLLKSKFTSLCGELVQMIPDLRLGIIFYLDHGSGDPYVTRVHDLSADVQSLTRFISETPTGCGGDAHEAVEDALFDLSQMNWRSRVAKSVVLFGDAAPHEAHQCPLQYSYFDITKGLFDRDVTINCVYCNSGYTAQNLQQLVDVGIGDFSCKFSYPDHPEFFSWIANITGGMIIGVEEIEDLVEIIKASAAKDSGTLDEYEKMIKKTTPLQLRLIEVAKKADHRKAIASKKQKLIGTN